MDLQTRAEIERIEKGIPAKREYKCVFRIQAFGENDPTTTLLWEDISEVVPGFDVPQFDIVSTGRYALRYSYVQGHPIWGSGDTAVAFLKNSTAVIAPNSSAFRAEMILDAEVSTIEIFNYFIGSLVAGPESVTLSGQVSPAQGVMFGSGLDADNFSGGLLCVLTYYPPVE